MFCWRENNETILDSSITQIRKGQRNRSISLIITHLDASKYLNSFSPYKLILSIVRIFVAGGLCLPTMQSTKEAICKVRREHRKSCWWRASANRGDHWPGGRDCWSWSSACLWPPVEYYSVRTSFKCGMYTHRISLHAFSNALQSIEWRVFLVRGKLLFPNSWVARLLCLRRDHCLVLDILHSVFHCCLCFSIS